LLRLIAKLCSCPADDGVESELAGKINRLDTKLTKFEDREIDKHLQPEVRVTMIERHLGLDKKIAG
jgi:hypothetical protein